MKNVAPRYSPDALHAFCVAALEATQCETADATAVADGLLAADLRGVHTHGVLRLGVYVDRILAGSIDPRARLEIVRYTGPIVVVDAHAGAGIAMATRAMDLAIERARLYGVGIVGARNSSHCGMLAHYAMRALPECAIGFAASNADSQVAVHGSQGKFLGTNPLAVAIPAGSEAPIVLDMATSVVAHTRIEAAAERKEAIPCDWAIDAAGKPTTDAAEALAGALLPFGGAKGSGISLLIDILAGLLPGGRSGPEIVPLYQRLDEPQGVGHLLAALRVDAFDDPAAFAARVDEIIRRVRSLPRAPDAERIYLPGEREHLCSLSYRAEGIPLPTDAVAELARAAKLTGTAVPEPVA